MSASARPELSVCIPTRNFGAFIGHTLDSVLPQLGPHDEVVIVDGNSTDNTPDVVADYERRDGRLRYLRQQTNGGVDRDLALAVSMARSEYCWLFSADDGLVDGALAAVRAQLASAPAVLLLDRIDCDFELRPLERRRWTIHTSPIDYRLADGSELRRYFAAVRSLAGMFSYISSILVRRSAWNDTPAREVLWGTHYAHVGRLFELLRRPGQVLRVAPLALVLCRGENDSFARQGRQRRFLIDVEGYRKIKDEVFADEPGAAEDLLAAFRRDHGLAALTGVRLRCESEADWRSVVSELRGFGYSTQILGLAGLLGRISPLVVGARALRNGARRLLHRFP